MYLLSEEQIWDVIDGVADANTIALHTQLMVSDTDYQKHFAHINQLNQDLQELPLQSPSMRFEENVMDKLVDKKSTSYQRATTHYQLLAPLYFLALLTILTAIAFFSTSNTRIKSPLIEDTMASGMSLIESLTALLNSPTFFYTLVVLNIGLLLVVLDRKFLKPYFMSY
jgi:hypothetical protein